MMSNFAIMLIGLMLLMGGCRRIPRDLEVSQPTIDKEGGKVEVGKTAFLSVEVRNPGGIKLNYEWRADKGTIAPSRLSQTTAIYTAPNMTGDDIVILKVYSKGKNVFTSEPVKIEVVSGVISTEGQPPIRKSGGPPAITITKVPRRGGGPIEMEEIAGEVSGVDHFDNYRVVIYSLTNYWYVQPYDTDPYTTIDSDGTWSTYIHLGIQYAALLVERSYKPPTQVIALPSGAQILAKATAKPKR